MERIGRIEVTHPDKVYFPSLGVTKRQVIAYYEAVAGPVLRAVGNRPIVLKRFPDGVGPNCHRRNDSSRLRT